MNFFKLIEQEKQLNSNSQFDWGKYVAYLQKHLNIENNCKLQKKVSEFILFTDLIDDLMDKDRPEIYETLLKNEDLLASSLFETINEIKSLVSTQSYAKFIDMISEALFYQQQDHEYELSLKSKESDYFSLVNRSVLLAQSIIYLVDAEPPKKLVEAIGWITTSAQIENDLEELEKDIPYDLLDSKGTLPLIKSIEWLKKDNKKELGELLNINREEYLYSNLNELLTTIHLSPVIPYCQLLRVSLENKAKTNLKGTVYENIYTDLFGKK